MLACLRHMHVIWVLLRPLTFVTITRYHPLIQIGIHLFGFINHFVIDLNSHTTRWANCNPGWGTVKDSRSIEVSMYPCLYYVLFDVTIVYVTLLIYLQPKLAAFVASHVLLLNISDTGV